MIKNSKKGKGKRKSGEKGGRLGKDSSSTRSSGASGTTSRRPAVQPPGVRCTTAYRSRVIGFPAGDYLRGPEAAGVHTTQDIAAGRSACLSTEGLRGILRTGHHHSRQLVTADRKVPSTLQISAGAAATEEGGTRQVVASQLQADI